MGPKIVIIGNGFDLSHFLPTSYNHLISVLKVIEKNSYSNDYILYDELFKEKDDFFLKVLEFYETQNIKFNLKNILDIKQRLKENEWFQYFKIVDNYKIKTWIDFEKEIKTVLTEISNFFEMFNSSEDSYSSNFTSTIAIYDYKLNDNFLKKELLKKILNIFKIIDNNIFSNDYVFNIGSQIQYLKEEEILNNIYSSLEKFIGILTII